jgi:hypothetical protein
MRPPRRMGGTYRSPSSLDSVLEPSQMLDLVG